MSLVEVDDVSRRFGSATAVDGISLRLEGGEVVGLLGANGAGKTTLIRMVLGLLRPTAGRITVLGQPAGRADRHTIGYVPQGLGLYRDLTVAENLEFVASAFGVERPRLEPSLAAVADRLVGEIPLGLRRRVAFVSACCHDPSVLVLDEPTSGVGPLGRVELWESIHRTAGERGAGVLVTTHHMDEAEECDRVIVMAGGRQVAAGRVDDIIGDLASVSVTGVASADLDRLRAGGMTLVMDGAGWRVVGATVAQVRATVGDRATVSQVPASFEEAFVALAR
jgi:ABC-2 type transport system ATP-binding protein/ribosome-dependent ATPase